MDERLSLTLSDLLFHCGIKQHPVHPPPKIDLEYKLDYWRSSLGIKVITPVILEIADFDKHTSTNTNWYSSPFFAYEKGYLMCLKVYTAGTNNGEGTHLSIYFHLMKGPFDDKLKWPLRGQFSIELINPTTETCYPYYKVVRFDERFADYNRITAGKMSNTGLGYSKFIDLSKISAGIETLISNLTAVDSFLTKHNSLSCSLILL